MSSASSSPSIAAELPLLYGKRFGAYVSSGMAAIELALEWLQVQRADEVVVPDTVCYRVASAVRRSGADVTFVRTSSRLLPDVESVKGACNERTKAVIAVHQYGLPFPMAELRASLPSNIKVIEDASQAFGVISRGSLVGAHSDLVVTSFGPSKPLTLGGGGALFGDEAEIARLMHPSRSATAEDRRTSLPRPYTFPARLFHWLPAAVEDAQRKLRMRRDAVEGASEVLWRHGIESWHPHALDLPAWHRVPVSPRNESGAFALLRAVDEGFVQTMHAIRTSSLPGFSAASTDAGEEAHTFLAYPDAFTAFLNTLKQC